MLINLFPDQDEILDNLRAGMRSSKGLSVKKALLLQAATGSGKTVIGSKMVHGVYTRGRRCIFNVPRRDLLKQTSETFTKYEIPHSFISAGKPFDPFARVYIGTTDTMANRIEKLPKDIDLLIPDETHFGADALGSVINHYKQLGSYIVGLSATPWKMNGQGLGIWYDDMVQGKSIRWLIDNKRLSDYRYFEGRTKEDFHALQNKTDKEISDFMESKRVIIGDCVSDYKIRCLGKLHIVRCTSIRHSQITAQTFRDAGVKAVHVDGDTPDEEKMRIFLAFADREISVITFADLLSFGWDLSAYTGKNVCVESASDLKPSKSLAAQLQFWGRAMRYKPFPAIFNDHVNNHKEHFFPCTEREWTLESIIRRNGGEKPPPTKSCPNCFYVHYPAPACPNCGQVYEIIGREIDVVKGELHEVDINAVRGFKPGYIDGLAEILPPLANQAEEELDFLLQYAVKNKIKNPAQWATNELAKRIAR